ncbi:MAG: GNAT family N-acetyltransferase [Oscillospiraceae bacterium]|jgi:ribosomal protein S18 acetylase RimI-like enzyme|nr:GNAT family N-acetyltransferase [Oscillospiraceae bacterium]
MSVVRRARAEDIPAISRLLVQVNMVHHTGRPDIFKGPTVKYTPEQLAEIIKNEETPVFVSVGGDGEVEAHAFCVFKQFVNDNLLTDIKTLYIDDICVFEHLRGKGVGRGLYEHVLSFARERGCYNVTLNVWECNPGAKSFYEKCGMIPQKTGMEVIL